MKLGIDLGTTYSVAARLDDDGEPEVIENKDGHLKTPSVVQILDDETNVGRTAINKKMMHPDETVDRVKRHMGDEDWTVEINGESHTPEAISARILTKLKLDVEEQTGESIDEVIITVPADFGVKEREATRNAAIMADFGEEEFDPNEDISLLTEPVAASIRYGADAVGETLFVYDLGGGTFDATIVEVSELPNGELDYQVVGTEGAQRLGGEDIDDKIYQHIKGDMLDNGHPDPDDNDVLKDDLYDSIRDMKHALSNANEGEVVVNLGTDFYEYTMSRDEFDDLIDPIVTQTFNKIDELFAHDRVDATKQDVDRVLLVGGSTRIDKVQREVEEYFEMDPAKDLKQDLVVAEGAAMATELDVTNRGGVLPKSIGLTVEDRDSGELMMVDIMDKNTEVPETATERNLYKTHEDNPSATFEILEGEQTLRESDGVRALGEFDLTDLEPGKNPEFEVTYEVDKDGRLFVEATNLDTGEKENTTVNLNLQPDVEETGTEIQEEMGSEITRGDDETEGAA